MPVRKRIARTNGLQGGIAKMRTMLWGRTQLSPISGPMGTRRTTEITVTVAIAK